ncbi:hypothetical protein [Loktanella sp. M215]|uniref:hypothetical protein n=1 Tax=Loktanella sp. M215 TaxID=2675431 RepID=UPI001F40C111|nr:hypothetical protein [Loktanella sp. M215]MCF7700556.1 hypothetical protein [Loktanella sp. M215]
MRSDSEEMYNLSATGRLTRANTRALVRTMAENITSLERVLERLKKTSSQRGEAMTVRDDIIAIPDEKLRTAPIAADYLIFMD